MKMIVEVFMEDGSEVTNDFIDSLFSAINAVDGVHSSIAIGPIEDSQNIKVYYGAAV